MNLAFPDSTYSSSSKPSTTTLKADLQTIETDFNAHVADTTIHFLASTLYPIGIIVEFKVATNPATLLGFGTWAAFGTGRVTVAIDAGQTEFDTLEETGGAKTHTLTEAEMPAHTHTMGITDGDQDGSGSNGAISGAKNTGSTGGGGAHNNLQPYIVVYRWTRTA